MKDATKNIMKLPRPAQVIKILDVPEYFKALKEQRLMKERVKKK